MVSHVSETADLSINYGGHTVSNRDQLALSQTAEEPEVVIDGSNTYTLVMVVCNSCLFPYMLPFPSATCVGL